MCLNKITKVYKTPRKMKFYKVFNNYTINDHTTKMDKYPNALYGEFFRIKQARHIGRRYQDNSGSLLKSEEWCYKKGGHKTYKTGFHGFIDIKDAYGWCGRHQVVVECEGLVHTIGVEGQYDARTVCVAKTMRLKRVIN
jgi:hypothetical protein